MQPRLPVHCLLCACALAAPVTAAVAQPLDFDCVMDPAADIHLGAATQGLLQEVLVSRGQTVTKGQIVARLWSDVETATLALLILRAESDAAILARQFLALDEHAQVLGDVVARGGLVVHLHLQSVLGALDAGD